MTPTMTGASTASALAALSPAKRAAVIYGAAQAELSQRLWQAALGSEASGGSSSGLSTGRERHSSADFRDQDSELTAMLTLLAREFDTRKVAVDRPRTAVPIEPIAVPGHAIATADVPGATEEEGSSHTRRLTFGVNARYRGSIDAAAMRTGIPPAALAAIVDAEAGKASDGSWQVYSRNPRSSAAGLGQFLTRTWEGMAETPGTWLHQQAQANGWLAGGRVQAGARAALLGLRYDPVAAINGVADYARRNLDGLRRAGVDAGDERGIARLAYLGHHLGLGDAVRFIREGGLDQARAKTLLDAQIGSAASGRRIAQVGNATDAHRAWMLGYLDRQVRPERFAISSSKSMG